MPFASRKTTINLSGTTGHRAAKNNTSRHRSRTREDVLFFLFEKNRGLNYYALVVCDRNYHFTAIPLGYNTNSLRRSERNDCAICVSETSGREEENNGRVCAGAIGLLCEKPAERHEGGTGEKRARKEIQAHILRRRTRRRRGGPV